MATRALQQVVCYYAWNTSSNAYETGDSVNHSTSWIKDGTRSATTNATAEVDSTNAPGLYKVTMTSTETDCIEGVLCGKSSTANVVLIGTMVAFDYLNTSAPATAGIPDMNAKNINNVSTSSVTTINANIGETQPINFTGTGASALVKSDMTDIAGSAVSTSTAQLGVNIVNIAGSVSLGAAGAVAPDWGAVQNKTTTNALTNTTISSTQTITSVSGSVGSVTGAVGSVTGNVGGNVAGSVNSVTSQVNANVAQWDGANVAGAIPPDAVFIRSGTAQAGGASTITLDAGASATNNLYQNQVIFIRSGTGQGESAMIASYVGATKVATINGTWATNPDNTSVFTIVAFGAISASVSGNVTVGGYAGGQDPGTYILATPANKLATDASGGVTVGSYETGQDPASLVLDASNGIETGVTVRQTLRYAGAALAGKLSGATSTTITFSGIGVATTRITATVDASGDRSSVALS